jgi:hypothetical protein
MNPSTTPSVTPKNLAPTSNVVLKRALIYGAFLTAIIAVVGAVAGGVVDGGRGVLSALVGTLMALVFMGITAGSILFANRFAGTNFFVAAFFGIIMGGWLIKFVIFLVLVVTLRDASWINPIVLLLSIIAGVLGSLVVDVLVVMKSRIPYVSDVQLPRSHQ